MMYTDAVDPVLVPKIPSKRVLKSLNFNE